MKKSILILLLAPMIFGCTQELEQENADLKSKNEELNREVNQKDSLINDFVEDFTTIQENLAAIREKEESIQEAREEGPENSMSTQEDILKDVEAINELLSQNRQTIADLNDKVKRYSVEVGKFKGMVENLNRQIEEKDNEIVNLKENLATMNFQMERLNAKLDTITIQNEAQKQTIEEQTTALNTAYYAIGNFDDLNQNNVVTKEGGFIGIGATKTLANNFNKDYFTKIDIRETTVIPLDIEEDDLQIVSKHDPSSYKLNKTNEELVTNLEIVDPTSFWRSSKYLVILTD